MRKIYLALFSILLYFPSSSQEIISKITKSYFRSDPFGGEFSSFMVHLLKDPSITNKILEKRTDSSFFYFQGAYKTFNPFFFKPKRVEIILTEFAVELDSLSRDTIYSYQLLAYNNDTKEGTEELKKEFDKIFRRYKGSFFRNTYAETPAEDKVRGVTYNFFDVLHRISPFSVSWFGPDENKEMCLVLTIRMDTYNNRAILPVPFYAPQ
jgi:hypothetical protein